MLLKLVCLIYLYLVTLGKTEDDVNARIDTLSELVVNLEEVVKAQNEEILKLNREVVLLKSQNVDNARKLQYCENNCGSRNENVNRDRRLLLNGIENGNRIAFYAYMSHDEGIQQHKTLIFDVAKTNFGHGYNNNTGAFTAPASGVYVLTFTLHPSFHCFASVDIVVNNEIEGAICTDSNENTHDLNAATGVVVVWMNQGDVSFVRTSTKSPAVGNLYSSSAGRCSFAGWKIL